MNKTKAITLGVSTALLLLLGGSWQNLMVVWQVNQRGREFTVTETMGGIQSAVDSGTIDGDRVVANLQTLFGVPVSVELTLSPDGRQKVGSIVGGGGTQALALQR